MKSHAWREVLVNERLTIEESIKAMEDAALRILVVVDDDRSLLGTVTDGDIRRAILRRAVMTQAISSIMNTDPVIGRDWESDEIIRARLEEHDVLHLPILGQDREVVGLRVIQEFFVKKQRENPVVLMAGGLGSRLRPLTEGTPKPLLNVGDRPILETILCQFIEDGFRTFFLSTHYRADQVVEFFGDGSKWGVEINYLEEKSPLGTAGVLGLLPIFPMDVPVIVMNGDVLSNVNFGDLLTFHQCSRSDCTVAVKQFQREVPYGVVEATEGEMVRIVEKPIESHLVNAGIYVIESRVIDRSDDPQYQDMPSYLNDLVAAGRRVDVFPMHEYWLDIGRHADYETANREILSIERRQKFD